MTMNDEISVLLAQLTTQEPLVDHLFLLATMHNGNSAPPPDSATLYEELSLLRKLVWQLSPWHGELTHEWRNKLNHFWHRCVYWCHIAIRAVMIRFCFQIPK